MTTLLIPVDGSAHSLRAVERALQFKQQEQWTDLVLLSVAPLLLGRTRGFFTTTQLNLLYERQTEEMQKAARALLDKASQPYNAMVVPGTPVDAILAVADEVGAAQIYMGTRGHGAAASILLGSVANRVASLARIPVTLVN
ncbi:nucleotide-binding universal stress UspA family protein [Silvimonas terrae]|uniref:Nucleotide-binding universal stress UspA family protein n=1 Tax=Silvimonas terrae TaxID=300266 RepID=A0A840R7U1_9NEIS|nr:universal stress protein [Silvimonas terrae]MBB5189399.1 nucleotide-binding universal stress UspA family protein [Silvimonas terrae]